MLRFRICGSTIVVLEDGDGQVLLQTPPQNGILSCRATIVNIRLTALLDSHYERCDVANGWAFTLRGANGIPIASSRVFASEADRERAIAAVRRHAASSPVEYAPAGARTNARECVLADIATPRESAPTTSQEVHLAADDGADRLRHA